MFILFASLITYALYFLFVVTDKQEDEEKYSYDNGACDSVDYEIADQMEKKNLVK